MTRLWKQFVSDECGALLVSDWAFLATILVIAVLPSVYGLRNKASDRDLEQFQSKKPASVAISHGR